MSKIYDDCFYLIIKTKMGGKGIWVDNHVMEEPPKLIHRVIKDAIKEINETHH